MCHSCAARMPLPSRDTARGRPWDRCRPTPYRATVSPVQALIPSSAVLAASGAHNRSWKVGSPKPLDRRNPCGRHSPWQRSKRSVPNHTKSRRLRRNGSRQEGKRQAHGQTSGEGGHARRPPHTGAHTRARAPPSAQPPGGRRGRAASRRAGLHARAQCALGAMPVALTLRPTAERPASAGRRPP